ncbi:hypothetical protein CVIRNUC_006837 [Coccomyxa viridis]|uniref:FAD-binding PCMH-type domain-containing protein n=1 Tax=Coccomyxa viridis TaxID=1274662 RepID=A0AAV1I8V0_9CHLO|nr:hypothetical protein CVIRNUC_006837 [Coccomyxa viridis]
MVAYSVALGGRVGSWAVVAGVLIGLCAPLARATTCREGPTASPDTCSLPVGLGNFQGYYQCNSAVEIARPGTKAELADIVQQYSLVKGVGVGHSWWQEQFCAGENSSAVGIVLTELSNTRALIESPTYPVNVAPDFPIQVHEENDTVTVQAGVTQRILVDYLAAHTTAKAPQGYTLPAFAWYVDQTVGGAVATGTHGSTMHYGSLSSQAIRIQMVLANGTAQDFTPQSAPHLWRAAQISVGRLGVITELDFEIIPQQLLTRTLDNLTFSEYQSWLTSIQNTYKAALQSGDPSQISAALKPLDRTQLFWYPPLDEVWRFDYNSTDMPEEYVPEIILAAAQEPTVPAAGPSPPAGPVVSAQAVGGRRHLMQASAPVLAPGVFAQAPTPELGPRPLYIAAPAQSLEMLYSAFIKGYFYNGTFPERQAILSENEFMNTYTSNNDPYDQYEVSVPIEIVGDCMAKVGRAVAAENLGDGFLVPPLIRFVNGEGAYLSMSNGGPRAYFNIEDHISKSSGVENTKFQRVMSILVSECSGRLHWGKAGWPRYNGCFDGAKAYPDTWCHFGCAVQELDPGGKFRSLSDVWSWSARNSAGDSVPLSSCCGPNGFSTHCSCAPRVGCSA